MTTPMNSKRDLSTDTIRHACAMPDPPMRQCFVKNTRAFPPGRAFLCTLRAHFQINSSQKQSIQTRRLPRSGMAHPSLATGAHS